MFYGVPRQSLAFEDAPGTAVDPAFPTSVMAETIEAHHKNGMRRGRNLVIAPDNVAETQDRLVAEVISAKYHIKTHTMVMQLKRIGQTATRKGTAIRYGGAGQFDRLRELTLGRTQVFIDGSALGNSCAATVVDISGVGLEDDNFANGARDNWTVQPGLGDGYNFIDQGDWDSGCWASVTWDVDLWGVSASIWVRDPWTGPNEYSCTLSGADISDFALSDPSNFRCEVAPGSVVTGDNLNVIFNLWYVPPS